jgi:hypothetical protein
MIMAANSKPPTIANLRLAMPATTDAETFAGAGATAGFSGGLVWTETC